MVRGLFFIGGVGNEIHPLGKNTHCKGLTWAGDMLELLRWCHLTEDDVAVLAISCTMRQLLSHVPSSSRCSISQIR